MERKQALNSLSPTNARILRLAEDGLGDDEIARQVGVVREAVGPMLDVARAKLEHLLAADDPGRAPDAGLPERPSEMSKGRALRHERST